MLASLLLQWGGHLRALIQSPSFTTNASKKARMKRDATIQFILACCRFVSRLSFFEQTLRHLCSINS